jgi:acetyl esterase/lipase
MVANLDREQVAATLAGVPFRGTHPRYAVQAYRIEYRTIDVHAAATTASALVALPLDRPGPAVTVAWEHGTRVGRADVASMSGDNLDRPAAVLFASAGFVTVSPDYLGLGTGPGAHPYAHARSEATASLDAVRAGRTLASRLGQHLSSDVEVSGFSQGGQAAMALAPEVERTPGLRLRAVAAISGPYDLAGTELPALWDGRVDPLIGAFYLAYWTLSSNTIYNLYGSPSEVFQAPYDQSLPPLFDGDHDESAIIPALAPSPADLVTARYAARLRHPEGSLLTAVQENSRTCQWRTTTPVRLYAASGDREVPIGNTERCADQLRALGTQPTVKNLGDVEHLSTPVVALPGVVDWFLHQP